VALACGLTKKQAQMYFFTNDLHKRTIQDKINVYQKQIKNSILVVDGTCLTVILEHKELLDNFFRIALKAPCLALCRCTPT
jgi:hypothetical protein